LDKAEKAQWVEKVQRIPYAEVFNHQGKLVAKGMVTYMVVEKSSQ
jgi:acyl-coenzyme A thioesterase PaaI-like protein